MQGVVVDVGDSLRRVGRLIVLACQSAWNQTDSVRGQYANGAAQIGSGAHATRGASRLHWLWECGIALIVIGVGVVWEFAGAQDENLFYGAGSRRAAGSCW